MEIVDRVELNPMKITFYNGERELASFEEYGDFIEFYMPEKLGASTSFSLPEQVALAVVASGCCCEKHGEEMLYNGDHLSDETLIAMEKETRSAVKAVLSEDPGLAEWMIDLYLNDSPSVCFREALARISW